MARLLLDTHVFLWWLDDAADISIPARRAIADIDNDCFLSLASCWELAIKSSLGKLKLARPVERFVAEQLSANGFHLLPIELRHTAKVETLPFHHRDPFDRLLIAQALAEQMTVVSADSTFVSYDVTLVW